VSPADPLPDGVAAVRKGASNGTIMVAASDGAAYVRPPPRTVWLMRRLSRSLPEAKVGPPA
jgi:hypothetical protein